MCVTVLQNEADILTFSLASFSLLGIEDRYWYASIVFAVIALTSQPVSFTGSVSVHQPASVSPMKAAGFKPNAPGSWVFPLSQMLLCFPHTMAITSNILCWNGSDSADTLIRKKNHINLHASFNLQYVIISSTVFPLQGIGPSLLFPFCTSKRARKL